MHLKMNSVHGWEIPTLGHFVHFRKCKMPKGWDFPTSPPFYVTVGIFAPNARTTPTSPLATNMRHQNIGGPPTHKWRSFFERLGNPNRFDRRRVKIMFCWVQHDTQGIRSCEERGSIREPNCNRL